MINANYKPSIQILLANSGICQKYLCRMVNSVSPVQTASLEVAYFGLDV